MEEAYLNTFDLILIIGAIQGFLFIIVMFFINKLKDKALFFLSLTVLFLSINNLQTWLIESNIEVSFYYLKYFKLPWNIFLAPMFYLFLVNYLRIEKRIKKLFLTTIIFFVFCISARVLLLNYFISQDGTSHFSFILRRFNSIEDIIIFAFTISIFLHCGIIFFKRKKRYVIMSSYDNLKWIKTFFVLSGIVLSFWLLALFFNYYFDSVNTSYFYSPLRIGSSFLIYWIGYQGFYQHKFVNNRMIIRDQLTNQIPVSDSISKGSSKNETNSGLHKHLILFHQIDDFIVSKKKFTDPVISLESLASNFNISSSFLSQLINKYSNSNFADYINRYRVEQVKELLIDENYNNYTILSIGLESGFNSKSTFYTAFKKHTCLTPAAYKKNLLRHKLVRNHGV